MLDRRNFVASALASMFSLGVSTRALGATSGAITLVVGSYSDSPAANTYLSLVRFMPTDGGFDTAVRAIPLLNPSYAALHPSLATVYAVESTTAYQGGGGLVPLSSPWTAPTAGTRKQTGAYPCYVSIDAAGRYLFVANYSGGSVAMYPVDKRGRIGAASSLVQHSGSGPNPYRQQGPHPHATVVDPSGRYLLVPDLGADRVVVYSINWARGRLSKVSEYRAAAGAGPRHLAFGAKSLCYLTTELNSSLDVLALGSDGVLSKLETHSLLPAGVFIDNGSAHVAVAPGGRFLYASNRGHDSIAGFAIDQNSGRLSLVGHWSSGGSTPRHFALSTDGQWLVVANQGSNRLSSFALSASGAPIAAHHIDLGQPGFVAFAERLAF